VLSEKSRVISDYLSLPFKRFGFERRSRSGLVIVESIRVSMRGAKFAAITDSKLCETELLELHDVRELMKEKLQAIWSRCKILAVPRGVYVGLR
jgi:hypothetical protein